MSLAFIIRVIKRQKNNMNTTAPNNNLAPQNNAADDANGNNIHISEKVTKLHDLYNKKRDGYAELWKILIESSFGKFVYRYIFNPPVLGMGLAGVLTGFYISVAFFVDRVIF